MIRKLMIVLALVGLFAVSAMAEEGAAAAVASNTSGWAYLSAGIAMGLSVIGGAFSQGRAAAAALEGIARNPSARGAVFAPMLIALAFMEALAILGFVIAITLTGK